MKADPCQLEAKESKKEKIKRDRNFVLSVFQTFGDQGFTAREIEGCSHGAVSLNSVRSRITELEQDGFLVKSGKVKDHVTKLPVNQWSWTGQYIKKPTHVILVQCEKCKGRGKHPMVVVVDVSQKDFLNDI